MMESKTELSFCIDHLVTMLHCPFSLFDSKGNPLKKWGGNTAGYRMITGGKDLVSQFLLETSPEFPLVCSRFGGILFSCMLVEEEQFLIAGPIYSHPPDMELKKNMVKKYEMTLQEISEIGYCDQKVFLSGICLLFYWIHGTKLSVTRLMEKNFLTPELLIENEKKLSGLIFEWQEEGWLHNPYTQEVREQESIENGDVEGLARSLEETFEGKFGRVARDELRQQKNLAIGVITMASRSAIRGGMNPEKSFFMADTQIQNIEAQRDPSTVIALKRQAEYEYAKEVQKLKSRAKSNQLVRQIRQYVGNHMHERIRITDIADKLGFTADYLSSVFQKNEGLSLSVFIQKEKMNRSKELLLYSDLSIKEIAASLAFCSQSHFGECFQKEFGESPAKYRRRKKRPEK